MSIAFDLLVGTAVTKNYQTVMAITTLGAVALSDLVVVCVVTDQAAFPTSVTDSGNNTYTAITMGGSNPVASIWWARLSTALILGDQISINGLTNGTVVATSILAFTATDSPDDKEASARASSTAADSGATATISQPNELLVAFVGVSGPSGDTYSQNGEDRKSVV